MARPIGAAGTLHLKFEQPLSFGSKRDYWINLGRAEAGDCTGARANGKKHNDNERKRSEIVRQPSEGYAS
jgi:hypothetical protein